MLDGIHRWRRKIASGHPRVTPTRVIEDVVNQHWDMTVDVAVVGFGGAGAAAAIEARDQGATVAIVERFNGGGSTKISGGIVYAGGGTTIQHAAGINDSAENMFNYLSRETGDAVCATTLRRFCDDSAANLDWLTQQGVPFQASLCPFKTSYPSNDYYLYYSGNESFKPYTDTATPAPRGHRAHGKGVSGASLFTPLQGLLGVALLIGWAILIRSTSRSLGFVGILLGGALCGMIIWVLVDQGWVSLGGNDVFAWVIIIAISALLGTGLSWSHIRRRISGQLDVDDIDND